MCICTPRKTAPNCGRPRTRDWRSILSIRGHAGHAHAFDSPGIVHHTRHLQTHTAGVTSAEGQHHLHDRVVKIPNYSPPLAHTADCSIIPPQISDLSSDSHCDSSIPPRRFDCVSIVYRLRLYGTMLRETEPGYKRKRASTALKSFYNPAGISYLKPRVK